MIYRRFPSSLIFDNDYGKSKKEGEDFLLAFGKENGNPIYIY